MKNLISKRAVKSKTKKHPGQTWLATTVIYFFGWVVFRLFYNIKVEGEENIPPGGSLLVLAKHQRLSDIPLGSSAIFKKSSRRPWCIMKESLNHPYTFGYLLKCGGIPIDRKNPEKSKESFSFSKKILSEGHVVCIFPEQTYYPWKMGKGKVPGFRVIAGKPEIPLQIICLGFEYGKKRWRTSVTIRFGKVDFFTTSHDPEKYLFEKMKEIAELSNLEYTEYSIAKSQE